MKVSKYTTDILIDDKKRMLYNTLSRQYFVYEQEKREEVWEFLNQLNKNQYTEDEVRLFQILLNRQIIVRDDVDEMLKLESLENERRFQEHTYKIMIYATNACNFRCVYCEQEHAAERLHEDVMESIIRLADRMADKVRCIQIDWFGGEPLLETERIIFLMEKLKKVCKIKNCRLIGTMTTNGYLLTRAVLEKLWRCNVKDIQITVDGNKKSHDSKRVLANGSGTYDVIVQNIKMALEIGMRITLRINIDEENAQYALDVLDEIPLQYREQVFVSISNVFQNEKTINTFGLLKRALELGFACHDRWNRYVHCHACLRNAAIIHTNGDILLCSHTRENEKRMGRLTEEGNICMERMGDYFKLKTLSARKNPQCKSCMELPYCIGSCKYQRMQDNTRCVGTIGDGLQMQERALLDYYSDVMLH